MGGETVTVNVDNIGPEWEGMGILRPTERTRLVAVLNDRWGRHGARATRRVRTGPVGLNGYGHYVFYMSQWRSGHVEFMALNITAGEMVGVWKFDL